MIETQNEPEVTTIDDPYIVDVRIFNYNDSSNIELYDSDNMNIVSGDSSVIHNLDVEKSFKKNKVVKADQGVWNSVRYLTLLDLTLNKNDTIERLDLKSLGIDSRYLKRIFKEGGMNQVLDIFKDLFNGVIDYKVVITDTTNNL